MPSGRGFTYDAIVSGGVEMSFDDRVDLPGAIGHEGDGSRHYYWYVALDEMVSFGQSPNVNLANVNQFDTPDPNNFGNPITFHGSAVVSGSFLDASTVCQTSNCN